MFLIVCCWQKDDKIPWGKILTSRPVWAIVVTHMCANWGTYTFLTNIPTYMKEVLKFNIKDVGWTLDLYIQKNVDDLARYVIVS